MRRFSLRAHLLQHQNFYDFVQPFLGCLATCHIVAVGLGVGKDAVREEANTTGKSMGAKIEEETIVVVVQLIESTNRSPWVEAILI